MKDNFTVVSISIDIINIRGRNRAGKGIFLREVTFSTHTSMATT